MREESLERLCQEYKELLSSLNNSREKIEKLQRDFFKKHCKKEYQDTCEPFYCIYRINDECNFIKELANQNTFFEKFGLEIKILF